MILQLHKISKAFGIVDILSDISFTLEDKEKASIVGVNGAGKSTLFKIITGELSKDDGTITVDSKKTIGYLSQDIGLNENDTIYNNLISVFEDILDLEVRIDDIVNELSNPQNDLISLSEQHDKLIEEYKEKGGYSYKGQITGILNGLSIGDVDTDTIVSTLSGGQKTRVALAKLLLEKPDLLLLDEPTNHLDIDAINWLENYLKNYQGAVLIISHDRYFLDLIVTKVIEIENTKSKVYFGNYTDFTIKKEIDREVLLKQYENYQKEVKRQTEVIMLLKSFNREKFVKRARSREKLLSKMEVVDRPMDIPDSMRMSFSPSQSSGFDVLNVENASKSFPGKELFSNLNLKLYKGDKVCLIGENGIGKTTLFKSILDENFLDSGKIFLGANVITSYYDQEHALLDENNTLFEEIQNTNPKLTNTQIRSYLAAFVFTGDDVFKKIDVLSGGEKGRLSLLKLMLSKANFLLLDEPTNHLDMYSKEILENAINAYEGTIFFISHDRYFINAVATKIVHLTSKGIDVIDGDYDKFLETKKEVQVEEKEEIITDAKQNRLLQKEELKEQRKKERELSKIEAEIEKTETAIILVDEELVKLSNDNFVEKLQEAYEKKENLENKLLTLMEKWEELTLWYIKTGFWNKIFYLEVYVNG